MREMRSRGVQMKAASALSEEAGLPGRETVRGDRVNGTAVPPAAEDARAGWLRRRARGRGVSSLSMSSYPYPALSGVGPHQRPRRINSAFSHSGSCMR
jgi:hypothetical protein